VNDAFSSAERRYLAETDDPLCDRYTCTNHAMPDAPFCARHEDDHHDYHNQENP
jgi:hypothetical protein